MIEAKQPLRTAAPPTEGLSNARIAQGPSHCTSPLLPLETFLIVLQRKSHFRMTPQPLRMKYYDDQQTGSVRKALEQEILGWPGVTAKPMMGCLCYFHSGKFFAFLVTKAVVITKLAEEDRAALSKKTGGEPFEMDGKTVKAWVRIPLKTPEDVKSVLPFVRKSYDST